VAVARALPAREARVAPAARGKRMRARFDGPRVVAGGEHDRRYTAHDSLVVRRRPIRIGLGKAVCRYDRVPDIVPADVATAPDAARAGEPAIGEIRKNAQVRTAFGPCGN